MLTSPPDSAVHALRWYKSLSFERVVREVPSSWESQEYQWIVRDELEDG